MQIQPFYTVTLYTLFDNVCIQSGLYKVLWLYTWQERRAATLGPAESASRAGTDGQHKPPDISASPPPRSSRAKGRQDGQQDGQQSRRPSSRPWPSQPPSASTPGSTSTAGPQEDHQHNRQTDTEHREGPAAHGPRETPGQHRHRQQTRTQRRPRRMKNGNGNKPRSFQRMKRKEKQESTCTHGRICKPFSPKRKRLRGRANGREPFERITLYTEQAITPRREYKFFCIGTRHGIGNPLPPGQSNGHQQPTQHRQE